MRKFLMLAVCLLTLTTGAKAVLAHDVFDGRNLAWGMSKDQVRTAMPGCELSWGEYFGPNEIAEIEAALDYYAFFETDEPIWGIRPGKICYNFWGIPQGARKLAMVYYTFTPYDAGAEALADYERLLAMLRESYGQPYIQGMNDDGKPDYIITRTQGLPDYLYDDAEGHIVRFLKTWRAVAQWHAANGEFNVLAGMAEHHGQYLLWFYVALTPDGPTAKSWMDDGGR